ncbi:MAG: PilN domain-containing protein [Bacillota bacterium]
MKTLVCIYSEGSDTKLAVVSKEKETIKLLKVADFDLMHQKTAEAQSFASISLDGMSGEFAIGDDASSSGLPGSLSVSNEGLLNSALAGLKLNSCEFIPAITEPALHYHVYEGQKDQGSSKMTQEIIEEIQKSKNITVAKESIGYTELAGGQVLSVFADGEIGVIRLINALAGLNGRQRSYKIPAVKSADLSLAYYVAKKKKFFPDDYSLIVYIGKEYSKLIFLQGKKLKHIGATLDVGTVNLHTYDVYFSKILLEMENGGIPRIDNVVLCGEDDSENLILSFYGTFPEANVSKLDFEGIDIVSLADDHKEKMSSFSVPIAVAVEYYDELNHETKGINLLPQYVKEEQKFLQFGWHALIILPILFAVTLYFTKTIIQNSRDISKNEIEITELTKIQNENKKILDQISEFQGKIDNLGGTQAILDSAASGTEVWSRMTDQIASFAGARKNMWITSIQPDKGSQVVVTGFGLNRSVLTEFTESTKNGLLKSVVFESIRDRNAYKFTLNFDLTNFSGKDE